MCRDKQTAADTSQLSGGTATGAATFSFIQVKLLPSSTIACSNQFKTALLSENMTFMKIPRFPMGRYIMLILLHSWLQIALPPRSPLRSFLLFWMGKRRGHPCLGWLCRSSQVSELATVLMYFALQAIERQGVNISYGRLLELMHSTIAATNHAPQNHFGKGVFGRIFDGAMDFTGMSGQTPCLCSNHPFDFNRPLMIWTIPHQSWHYLWVLCLVIVTKCNHCVHSELLKSMCSSSKQCELGQKVYQIQFWLLGK